MAGIQVDVSALEAKAAEIKEIDNVLDAQSDSKAAGKRATKNALVDEHADQEMVEKIVASLRTLSEEELYATFYAAVDAVENEFNDEAEQYITGIVESKQAEPTEKLSDAELQELQENRKAKVQEFKALANILEMFGQDISGVEEPKVRRGSRGPRGPRTLSKFQYNVNGVDLPEETNSLATVAKMAGDIKVKDLKAAITSQGIDLKNPPADWTAELPNEAGTLIATPLPEFADDFSEDEEESDAA